MEFYFLEEALFAGVADLALGAIDDVRFPVSDERWERKKRGRQWD